MNFSRPSSPLSCEGPLDRRSCEGHLPLLRQFQGLFLNRTHTHTHIYISNEVVRSLDDFFFSWIDRSTNFIAQNSARWARLNQIVGNSIWECWLTPSFQIHQNGIWPKVRSSIDSHLRFLFYSLLYFCLCKRLQFHWSGFIISALLWFIVSVVVYCFCCGLLFLICSYQGNFCSGFIISCCYFIYALVLLFLAVIAFLG